MANDHYTRIERDRIRLLRIISRHVWTPSALDQDYTTQAQITWLQDQGYVELWGSEWKSAILHMTNKGAAWLAKHTDAQS